MIGGIVSMLNKVEPVNHSNGGVDIALELRGNIEDHRRHRADAASHDCQHHVAVEVVSERITLAATVKRGYTNQPGGA